MHYETTVVETDNGYYVRVVTRDGNVERLVFIRYGFSDDNEAYRVGHEAMTAHRKANS